MLFRGSSRIHAGVPYHPFGWQYPKKENKAKVYPKKETKTQFRLTKIAHLPLSGRFRRFNLCARHCDLTQVAFYSSLRSITAHRKNDGQMRREHATAPLP